MTIAKSEQRIEQLKTRLAEIEEERTEVECDPDRAELQLAEAQAEEDRLSADIRSQALGTSADDLAAAMRKTAALKATLDKLKRETGPKLEKLNAEEQKLRDELTKATHDLNRAKFFDAVTRYEEAIRPAMLIADEIRALALLASVPLERQSALLDRKYLTIGGYQLFASRPYL